MEDFIDNVQDFKYVIDSLDYDFLFLPKLLYNLVDNKNDIYNHFKLLHKYVMLYWEI